MKKVLCLIVVVVCLTTCFIGSACSQHTSEQIGSDSSSEDSSVHEHDYQNGKCECGDTQEFIFEVVDDYLYFGEYPQTLKATDVTVSETADENGYYLGSDNERYAKVSANPYLPDTYKFANGELIKTNSEYYFKVEPIKWQILSNDGETLKVVCASALINHKFSGADNNGNNYKDSAIRSWLNNEFYNTAFSASQQQLILLTAVDNSALTTAYSENKYACANTEDKIYLLSYAEAFELTNSQMMSDLRKKIATDYARALGIRINTSEAHYGFANWWLRSPHDKANTYVPNYYALYVSSIGSLLETMEVIDSSNTGVAPALQINVA